MTKEFNQLWRKNWLQSINELTSLDIQKKSWLDKHNTNPHWSFVEFMSCYFDELLFEEDYKEALEKGLVSKNEFEIVNPWHQELCNYNSPNNDDYNNLAILNDPNWLQIISLGLSMKNHLASFLNKKEKAYLLAKMDYPLP